MRVFIFCSFQRFYGFRKPVVLSAFPLFSRCRLAAFHKSVSRCLLQISSRRLPQIALARRRFLAHNSNVNGWSFAELRKPAARKQQEMQKELQFAENHKTS